MEKQPKHVTFKENPANPANPAEEYQEDISEIFDHFLDLMRTSCARVEVESQRFQGYCQVKLTLWKCTSCSKLLFTTFFNVCDNSDVKHLAQFMDNIQKNWRLYSPADSEDSSN